MDELPAEQRSGVTADAIEPGRGIVFRRERSAAHERCVVAGRAAILQLVVVRIVLGVFIGIDVLDVAVEVSERCGPAQPVADLVGRSDLGGAYVRPPMAAQPRPCGGGPHW